MPRNGPALGARAFSVVANEGSRSDLLLRVDGFERLRDGGVGGKLARSIRRWRSASEIMGMHIPCEDRDALRSARQRGKRRLKHADPVPASKVDPSCPLGDQRGRMHDEPPAPRPRQRRADRPVAADPFRQCPPRTFRSLFHISAAPAPRWNRCRPGASRRRRGDRTDLQRGRRPRRIGRPKIRCQPGRATRPATRRGSRRSTTRRRCSAFAARGHHDAADDRDRRSRNASGAE